MKNKGDDLIVGVDIGSSKIVVVISELDDMGNISVLGIGSAEAKGGMRGGVVMNIESTITAINQAIEDAEIQAGRQVTGVFVGISGGNIETINSKGVVAISGRNKEISEYDINRVIEAAKAVAIPMDREVIHIIPQSFSVDGQHDIKYPIGMVGTRLECQIHMITTPISSIQNILRCLDRCDIEVYDIVLQNLACSRAVLEDDEKEVGVLMIDIGAETSKVSIYRRGAPYYNFIYPLGGYLITNDVAAGLKVSLGTAEKIKLAFGVTHLAYVNKDETIQIPSIGGREPRFFARSNLVYIIRPRVEEMLNFIKDDLEQNGMLDKIGGGIVLCGGSANLPGIAEVCQEVFNLQTRIGVPHKLQGINERINTPELAGVNGLIRWGYERFNKNYEGVGSRKKEKQKGFLGTIKNLFEELF